MPFDLAAPLYRVLYVKPQLVRYKGLNHFFPMFFPTFCFLKFFRKFWKNLWKSLESFSSQSKFAGHVRSVTIYLTLSKRYFCMGVHTKEHWAGYNDDNIMMTKNSSGPVS
jgi:hypothetical protein